MTQAASGMRFLPSAATCLAALAVVSCSSPRPDGVEVYRRYDRPARFAKNPEAVEVKVSLARQRAYVMENGTPLLVMPVTVGDAEAPTPTGDFRITRKQARHRATDYGFSHRGDQAEKSYRHETPPGWNFTGRPMPYWCEFKPGYGFHTGWIKHFPSSDGCLRMHVNLAPKFFHLVRVGTPVNIRRTQPEDAKYANIPLPPDAGPFPDYPPGYYLDDAVFTDHLPPKFR